MPTTETALPSNAMLWVGRVMSALVVLFLIFDAVIKLIPIQPVTDSMLELGYPGTIALARGIGIITLICVALYVWPRTSVLGAVLLTGLLGGAIAGRQPCLHASAVRLLPRPARLGRALPARPAPEGDDPVAHVNMERATLGLGPTCQLTFACHVLIEASVAY